MTIIGIRAQLQLKNRLPSRSRPKTCLTFINKVRLSKQALVTQTFSKQIKIIKMSYLWMKQQQLTFNIINLEKIKALANKNIREAFNLATDRQQYVDTVTPASNPATGLTPAGMAKTNTGEDFRCSMQHNHTNTMLQQLKQLGLKD